eukprot:CAMPEP_0117608554 /NCGR_PEP_ID=MMETSP0784-20121206/80868_1 /TAXON_ID=39447 /ORGANISM="" /LENGTH=387 /DNA_ID=CAMNT_0005411831 /DNA_START=108 /DNA_END=1268 /DNA_ORIENTATION=+
MATSMQIVVAGFSLMCFKAYAFTFEEFVVVHNREYKQGTPEYEFRRHLFEHSAEKIHAQNSRSNKLWTAGFTHLSDWTKKELSQLYGWSRSRKTSKRDMALLDVKETALAESVMWTNLSATHEVKDQGGCGSCWAVATSTLLAAHFEIAWGKPRSFSVQELVNCVDNPKDCGGTGGCEGATPELAIDHVLKYGLATEAEVPYTGTDGQCTNSLMSKFQGQGFLQKRDSKALEGDRGRALGITSYTTLRKNEARPLMQALMHGPVGVSVDATDWSFYFSGVFDGCLQDATINHAVVAVGYGVDEDGTMFWKIQNSWGEDWGEQGFMRIFRAFSPGGEAEEACGIDYKPEDGVACKPYPDQDEVCGQCGILYDSVQPLMAVTERMRAGP